MAQYGKICAKLWDTPRFTGMSEDAQRLVIYSFSNRDCNVIGLYRFRLLHLTLDILYGGWAWKRKRLAAAFNEVLEVGWFRYDHGLDIVQICDWFDEHTIDNPNHLKYVISVIDQTPRTLLLGDLIKDIEKRPNGIDDNYIDDLMEALSKRLPNGIETVSKHIDIDVAIDITTDIDIKAPRKRGVVDEEFDILCLEVLTDLNRLRGKRGDGLDVEGTGHRKFIKRAVMKDRATLRDFLHVNKVKASQWLYSSMETHLVPKTLYSEKNFDCYRTEVMAPDNQLSEKTKKRLAIAAKLTNMEGGSDGLEVVRIPDAQIEHLPKG